jgi:acetyl esterase/lipase
VKVTQDMIDPQLRLKGAIFRRLAGSAGPEDLLKRSRRAGRLLPLTRRFAKAPGIRVRDEWIERPDGSRLRVVVAGPLDPQPEAPGLLWIHGGGYVLGSPDQDLAVLAQLIGQTDAVIVAPAYRLTTQAPYPAALDDCYAALLWLRDHAGSLGVRPDQLAVAGNSAGGGLTAAVTLRARDLGEVAVAFQMPIYPMIDDRGTASSRDSDAPIWDSITNRSAWQLYLGGLHGTDDVPAYAAPARATDHRGLPPTLTFVGELDPFLDETLAYVENLRAAGVPAECRVFPGAYHGFDAVVPGAEVSRRATAYRDRWLREAVRTWFTKG